MITALDARHRALGARMIPFAGWDMPVQYRGLVEEHNAVRTAAGLFDLSHMGELYVTGSRCRGGARLRARDGAGEAGGGPSALLDDLRRERRDPR